MGNNEIMKKKNIRNLFSDLLQVSIASLLFAVGYNMFIDPAGIILGGATGLATVINRFVPTFSVGTWILFLNLPLVLICVKVFGIRFILRTVLGTVLSSFALDTFTFFPVPTIDPLLSALLGGGIIGAALGLMYARGYNTGGADLLVFLLKRKVTRLSQGKIVLLLDAAVVLLSVVVFKNYLLIFYSAVTIYTEATVLDRVVKGFDRGQLVFIFSEKSLLVAEKIAENMGRGVTLIDTVGWYSGKNSKTLLCALRQGEVYALRKIIKETDESAFVVFTSASSIDGLGFEKIGE